MTDHLQKLKCEDKEQNRSILNKSLLSFRLHKGNWPALEKAETLISTSAWIEYSAQCKNVYIRSTMLFGTSTRQLGRRNQRSNIPFPLFSSLPIVKYRLWWQDRLTNKNSTKKEETFDLSLFSSSATVQLHFYFFFFPRKTKIISILGKSIR